MDATPVISPLELRSAVQRAYSSAADSPRDKHAFPVGRVLAERLGYPAELLDTLPTVSVEAFAGVSNVGVSATIPAAGTVLDVGCGAGLDSLVAARRVGPGGIVAGIDFSDAMLRRARRAATLSELTIALCRGDAEHLPLARDSVDVALVNGIFNLNPARTQIFEELARVVQPGGAVYAAELVLMEAVSRPVRFTEAEWFA